MKKLQLDLDALAVDAFATAAPVHTRRGTVRANDFEPLNRDWQPSEQSALACATGGFAWCPGVSDQGCTTYTGGYGDTSLCTSNP
jgi:hypothetical protein